MSKKKEEQVTQTDEAPGPVQTVEELPVEEQFVEKKTEYLRYTFSDPELLDLSKQLARKLAEEERAERELKEVTTQLKSVVTLKEGEVHSLSGLVQNGYEYRMIDCEIFFDMPERGKKTMIRIDTREIVSEQKMSGDDLQGQLFRKQEVERNQAAK